ncbi:MAG: GNAT family N-acetyltransferase [Pseudomonadota bacterium]
MAERFETILETERLLLRRFVPEDAKAMEGIFCDPEVMYFEDVESPEWVRAWLKRMIEECYPTWGFGMWAVQEKASGDVIGYCGLSRFPDRCEPHEAELGYRLMRKHWGKGIATEAVRPTCEFGLKVLGLSRIVAMIDPGNTASLRVAQKLGMRYQREVMFDGYTHPDHLFALP